MLEESQLEWAHVDVNILQGEQFGLSHLKLNPNNKIPAIIDRDGPEDSPYTMMESGAILIYLAEKTGKFLPKDTRKRYDTLQWLMFQTAHIGPMFGQASHFNNYKKENIQYAKDRYNNESVRLYRVLDNRLRDSPWIGCDEYTIADMATYPWTKGHKDRGIDKTGFPHFIRWFEAMEARPAVQRNNKMSVEIRASIENSSKDKMAINIYDTKDNSARLAKATKP